jgi:hypothetical protein
MEVTKFLEKNECDTIIRDLDHNIDKIKQSTNNGVYEISSYEVETKELSKNTNKIVNNLNKKVKEMIGVPNIDLVNSFFVRYSVDTKPDMVGHYDCDNFTTVINLNNDYVDGGTYFPLVGYTLVPQDHSPGCGLLFKGNNINSYHEALPVTSGVRYVLVLRFREQNLLTYLKILFLGILDKRLRNNKKNQKLLKWIIQK